MQLEDMSMTSLFLSSSKWATFLFIPFFSILKVATNWRPDRNEGRFLTESQKGKMKPEKCLPKTCLSLFERRSGGFWIAYSRNFL
jgi:hypothetical protein